MDALTYAYVHVYVFVCRMTNFEQFITDFSVFMTYQI